MSSIDENIFTYETVAHLKANEMPTDPRSPANISPTHPDLTQTGRPRGAGAAPPRAGPARPRPAPPGPARPGARAAPGLQIRMRVELELRTYLNLRT